MIVKDGGKISVCRRKVSHLAQVFSPGLGLWSYSRLGLRLDFWALLSLRRVLMNAGTNSVFEARVSFGTKMEEPC